MVASSVTICEAVFDLRNTYIHHHVCQLQLDKSVIVSQKITWEMSMASYDSLDHQSQHLSYHLPALLQSLPSMICYHQTKVPDPDPVAICISLLLLRDSRLGQEQFGSPALPAILNFLEHLSG